MSPRKVRKQSTQDQQPIARVEAWFQSKGWQPFAYQREVWSAYAAGESGLIHASTGTGKTYAAIFGPILEAMAEPAPASAPPLHVLWITPLRALSADTVRSLQSPIAHLELNWDVGLRTADTSSSVRARQAKKLPTILVTTPESLALFLTREESPALFHNLRTVIVDEWHELLASKRGVLTELALARLRQWQPGVRTWGLSATLGNLDIAAQALLGTQGTPRIIQGDQPKSLVIDSLVPAQVERFPWGGHIGLSLLPQVIAAIAESRSTLVFTNTRAQTEIWYRAILAEKPEWAGEIALHHSSLDREVREWVEDHLRSGELRCVVCTSSLDLGVDFSPVDRVLQVGSPKGVARLLQRAGRSGHQPGAISRVTCVPTHAFELVEITAARTAAHQGRIEGREPYAKPLDVLSQHLITVALGGGFCPEEMLQEVRTTHAYRTLTDAEWQWTLDFVVRGGDSLRAYPDFQRVVPGPDGKFRVTNRKVAHRHRLTVGTILSDTAVQVRFLRGKRLGTVEESFVARMKPGDRFTFAGHQLELVRLHELTAWVRKTTKPANVVARWMGSRMPLSSELSAAVREQLAQSLGEASPHPELSKIQDLLALQARWSHLPGPEELLIERIRTRQGHHLFLYPFEGRLVHEGLAALFAYRLARWQPMSLSLAVNDYGFEVLSRDPLDIPEGLIRDLLGPAQLVEDILECLNAAELSQRQFREVARVAGLVTPGYPGAMKSARQLQASSELFYKVFQEYDPGNLLLQQAHREVLERQFEHTRLVQALERISRSEIRLMEPPRPTPLAFPLLVERLRAGLSSESLEERVRKMVADLERAADREYEVRA